MTFAPRPLERRPVYEQVADVLREAILSGEMAPGSALPPERELCGRFGVGRTTIREALRALQTKGLAVASGPTLPLRVVAPDALTTEPLRDTLVHLLRLGRVPLDDLVGLGALLEGAGAEQVAQSDPRPDLTAAREQIASMRAAGADVAAFELADTRFHLELVRASGSEALTIVTLAVRDTVSKALSSHLNSLADPRPTLAQLIAEHEGILQAVIDGDGDTARRLSAEHLRRFYDGSA
ncbi:GntR family transcriptional regulator [Conexibacter stalactiti]|uniref:GntR family transcriptional regulator n=1 Tax=Conexibacter stalactiti TaxID=1940611 RepID=A0ABU4HSU2_9ACTN|nr:GntR family transcriptional regulator [Conexibacter stalactiti]MDW5596387.1 GntR family transcriptional regulator [Conexibacter stalactiti]MEC5037029.1 GntR family transcriptional regulator [Conexibacter stalactiti]